ncbi:MULTISPECIES: hypothetical protein [Pseudonocardia]|uniref:Uncharacterized protein n=2 Tax=Pseudonocardia TaxID=1847 RepID=A0A1Y2MS79_PSEAH|nr:MULTISPECIES: hypothetical protein [Pseudonocardia]OSY38075.1 hypothetical protein BG845_04248 [Pseudonocardia autotrophica]TDN75516.1 hypothetical protein C8E95_4693 [Pseudonocardia autotrophica]BBF99485.1 hypothetical protein Pdca_06950 [Pseudonocardia autotrophica]GEC28486.1 hypothetical protein PSA01_55150 [Pseudonocardia saturnea]
MQVEEKAPADTSLRRNGALITASFGFVWALTGASALPVPLPVVLLAATVTVVAIVVALLPGPAARPRRLPADWAGRYRRIGLVQGVLIAAVVAGAVLLGAPGLIAPAVCVVVGVHFLPLAVAVDQPGYRLTGIALVIAGAAGLVVWAAAGADHARAVGGLVAAVVLWVTSVAVARRP